MPRYLQVNTQLSSELTNVFDTHNTIETELNNTDISLKFENIPDRLFTDTLILGYLDEVTQNQYYNWAIQGLDISNSSILDSGCGRGDFFKIVLTNENINYVGIDTNPLLIDVGKKKYTDINLYQQDWMDIVDDFDWIFNILNLTYPNDNPLEYLKLTISKLLQHSKKGLILILLVSNNDDENLTNQTYKISDVINTLEELNIVNFGIDFTLNADTFKVVIFQ